LSYFCVLVTSTLLKLPYGKNVGQGEMKKKSRNIAMEVSKNKKTTVKQSPLLFFMIVINNLIALSLKSDSISGDCLS